MIELSDVHLWVNHFPLFAFFFGVMLYFLARKSAEIRRAGLWMIAIGGISCAPAFLSGEPAEEKVEHLPGIEHDLIEEHEEWGERAAWAGGISGALALAGLIIPLNNRERLGRIAAFLGILAFLVLAITAHHGGEIRRQDGGHAAPARHEHQEHEE